MSDEECRHIDNTVLDTRSLTGDYRIRRRRRCDYCNFRWTTYEIDESVLDAMNGGGARAVVGINAVIDALVESGFLDRAEPEVEKE